MKTNIGILTALFFALIVIFGEPANATKYIIQASGTSFSPDSITGVQIGDTIRWEWINGSHTTTSVNVPLGAAEWSSPLTQTTSFLEYKVTVAGTYNFKCIPHEAFGMKGVFIVEQTSGINDPHHQLNENLQIFPNPVKDYFTIAYSVDYSVVGEVRMINLVGGISESWILETSPGKSTASFQVGSLHKGIYFVEIYSGGKRVTTRKIIKE